MVVTILKNITEILTRPKSQDLVYKQVWEIPNCLVEREEDDWRQIEENSCMGRYQ